MRSFAALLPSVLFLSTVSFASVAQHANPADIKGTMSDSHRMFAYIIGMQTGNNLRKQLPQVVDDIDLEAMAQGIKEALAGQPPRLDVTEMTHWSKLLAMLEEREKGRVEQNLVNGKAFRDSYAKREGVQDTGTGIYYKVLTEEMVVSPVSVNRSSCTTEARIDGRVFDDSYDRGQPQVPRSAGHSRLAGNLTPMPLARSGGGHTARARTVKREPVELVLPTLVFKSSYWGLSDDPSGRMA